MTPSRSTLPDRRPNFVERVAWGGLDWLVSIGLDPEGVAREVFVDPADNLVGVDDDVLALVHDAAITASHLLQLGIRAADHAERLAGRAPSVLGVALRAAAEAETREGDWVRELEEWRRRRIAGESAAPDIRDLVTHPSVVREVCEDHPAAPVGDIDPVLP